MDWHRIRKSYCHSDVSRLEFRKKIRELKRTKEKFSMLHSRPISSIWNRKCERGESGSCIYDTEEEPNARSRWSGLKYMYIYYLRLNLKADNKLDWSIFETVSIFDVHSMPFACHEIGERSTLSVDSFRLFPFTLSAFRPPYKMKCTTSINASFVSRIRSDGWAIACHRRRLHWHRHHKYATPIPVCGSNFYGFKHIINLFPGSGDEIERSNARIFNRWFYCYCCAPDACIFVCISHFKRIIFRCRRRSCFLRCTMNREISKCLRVSPCGGEGPQPTKWK